MFRWRFYCCWWRLWDCYAIQVWKNI